MKLGVEPMSEAALVEMTGWRYEPPYDFYDGDGVLPRNPERFFEARSEGGELVGFYYFEERKDALFYGLGLRPELTGKGHGLEFLRTGLEFGRKRFRPSRIILDFAAFNERAITVYERAGFRITGRHLRRFKRWAMSSSSIWRSGADLDRRPDAHHMGPPVDHGKPMTPPTIVGWFAHYQLLPIHRRRP